MLLGNASVQKELKLDDQQIEKAKEARREDAARRCTEARESLQGLEGEERRTKMAEINARSTSRPLKSVGEFLKPEQVARLKQISYQVSGLQAFNDPEVAKKLNLTDAQKTEIREIEQEAMREMRPIFQRGFQNDREGPAMKKMAEAVEGRPLARSKPNSTTSSRRAWKEMLGAPFEVKYQPGN